MRNSKKQHNLSTFFVQSIDIDPIVPIIIFPYYCVIGGWVLKYFSVYLTGQGNNAVSDTFFTEFISKLGEPVLWLSIFIAVTAVIVLFGVEKGIEKVSRIMMPVLFILSIAIAIYGIFN